MDSLATEPAVQCRISIIPTSITEQQSVSEASALRHAAEIQSQ